MDTTKLIERLVDKMLEPYGVGYEYVLANPQIEGQDWFSYYTWDTAQERDFREWAIKEIRRSLKCSKEEAKKEYDFFYLMWGLKLLPNE